MSFEVADEVARSLEQWLIIKIMFFSGWLIVFNLFFYFMNGLLYVLCALRICLVPTEARRGCWILCHRVGGRN